jgi:hypothetical protein
MKKLMVVAVFAIFAAGAALVYAADAPQATSQKEENLFKIIMNSMQPGPGKEKNKIKNPLPTVTVFQNMSNGIADGSEKSRGQSLR